MAGGKAQEKEEEYVTPSAPPPPYECMKEEKNGKRVCVSLQSGKKYESEAASQPTYHNIDIPIRHPQVIRKQRYRAKYNTDGTMVKDQEGSLVFELLDEEDEPVESGEEMERQPAVVVQIPKFPGYVLEETTCPLTQIEKQALAKQLGPLTQKTYLT